MNNEEEGLFATLVALLIAIVATALIWGGQPDKSPNTCPDGQCPYELVENLADVPPQLRTENYSPYGSGSCVHASTITILKWQGQDELAEFWRTNYNSGEYSDRLILRMEAAGIKYAYTQSGDVKFLEWVCRNRLVAGIFYYPKHCINLVDLNEKEAVLLDNNATGQYIRVERGEFLKKWREDYGGFGYTCVYSPPPPYPKL